MTPHSTATRWKAALISLFSTRHVKERRETELADTMRIVCHELIRDLDIEKRLVIGARIETSARRHDIWALRACLFDAISMQHGEQVARDRLLELDSCWP